jgi:hypothetical protein
MCNQHEKEIAKEADVIERGQSSPSQDHEEGSSDQDFQISVGHTGNDRKEAPAAPRPPERSFWFDDATKEIGASPGSKGTIGGWVYVRSKTGHLKKRFNNRGSVP